MRTSIEISDNLLAKAKKVMRRKGVTLRSLVEEGLRKVLTEGSTESGFTLRDASFRGKVGLMPGVSEADIRGALEEFNEGRKP
ncbi:MAG: type II toxin-antitoxin system VapB family antitoxin [Myxococcaceae bacterium]|nr:type II toxin-antitoxin system VapB family antitoxin [Myxococcaceae bacterium]